MSKLKKKKKPRFLLQILQHLRWITRGKGGGQPVDDTGHVSIFGTLGRVPTCADHFNKGQGKTWCKKGMCRMSGLFAHKAKNNREKIRSQRRWAVDKLQFRHIPNQTRYLSCTCTSLISFISRASPTSRFLRPGEVPLRAHKSLGAFPPTGLLSKSQLLSARSCMS